MLTIYSFLLTKVYMIVVFLKESKILDINKTITNKEKSQKDCNAVIQKLDQE